MNCGFIVRPEVSKGDEHINKEHCTACKPFADKCDEEMLLTIRAERKCELRKMTESN